MFFIFKSSYSEILKPCEMLEFFSMINTSFCPALIRETLIPPTTEPFYGVDFAA